MANRDQIQLKEKARARWYEIAAAHPSKLPKKVQSRLRDAYEHALAGPSLGSYAQQLTEETWQSFDRYNDSWVAHPILEACFGRFWEQSYKPDMETDALKGVGE